MLRSLVDVTNKGNVAARIDVQLHEFARILVRDSLSFPGPRMTCSLPSEQYLEIRNNSCFALIRSGMLECTAYRSASVEDNGRKSRLQRSPRPGKVHSPSSAVAHRIASELDSVKAEGRA